MMTVEEEIAEFRAWSRQMTIKLMEKFPISNDPRNWYFDNDEDYVPLLAPLVGPDLYRDARNRPQKVSLDINSGKWRKSNGARARGFHAFVLLSDKILKIGKHGHDQIARGESVIYAGEVLFRDGDLLFWTNNSGHYKPHPMLATAMPFPIHRFSSHSERNPWFVNEALTVTQNTGKIARWLGWQISEVEAAYRQIKAVRYGKRW